MRLVACCVALVLLDASGSRAAVDFWLSSAATPMPGSAFPSSPGEVPNFEPFVGGSGKIYIWGRPEPGKSLVDFSLNLVAETQPFCSPVCTVPNAISFTSAVVFNPTFGGVPVRRFEYVDDMTGPTPLPLGTTRIDGLDGLRIFEGGPIPAVGIGSFADPLFDSAHMSWLIAEVSYNALATGESSDTRLFLEIGPIGMNHAGEGTIAAYVQFGDASDVTLNAHDNRGVHPGNIDGFIHPRVLPGDADRNGVVAYADYPIWRSNFGSMTQLAADHNHNGKVDAADYVVWRNNLGQTAGLGSAMTTPEPSAALLLGPAVFAAWHFRWRNVSRPKSWTTGDVPYRPTLSLQ